VRLFPITKKMKKRYEIIIIVLVILTTGFFAVGSASSNGKIDNEVLDNLNNLKKGDKTKIVIMLKEPQKEQSSVFGIKIQKTFSEMNIERERNREEIIREVEEKNVRHVFNDKIAVEVSKEKLNVLTKNKNIDLIKIDRPVKILLQDSVHLINASLVWSKQISNINITGIDETVCVIDTGIDFSHSALTGKNRTCVIDCISSPAGCIENCSVGDDNGHGTHVAGIIASSSEINGVAFDAGLIGIKSLNSGGSGSSSDVEAGMNWCLNNSDIYNISVISMSIGITDANGSEIPYNSYCDSEYSSDFTPIINNATQNNISVIVASGNNLGAGNITSPACIFNSTAVGSVRKDDATIDFNRNSLIDLIAPGFSINSTKSSEIGCLSGCSCSGDYMDCSGTSMSAPHVAGAFALIRQFFRLQGNRILTPEEIRNSLNSTGKKIYDSSSELNFSRINIYSAIVSLDDKSPNTTLTSPSDNTLTLDTNQTFSCNSTDSIELSNITFYLWNSSGNLINQTSFGVSGIFNETSINITGLSYDSYKWNCLAEDANNNSAFALSNFSLTISQILVSLISPSNNLSTNLNQTFSCNATSDNSLINATFYLWNSSKSLVYDETKINLSGTANSSDFNYNFTYQDNYEWNCRFFNNLSIKNFAALNFSVIYDINSPLLNVSSPLNNSWNNQANFSLSLNEIGNCKYTLNSGTANITMNSSDNLAFWGVNSTIGESNFSYSYSVIFYCNDSAGNMNSSSRFFGIDKTKPEIDIVSPEGGSSYTSNLQEINFAYNLSENKNISKCSLVVNGIVNLTNSSLVNLSKNQNFNQSFSPGNYNWSVNCTDLADNIGNSSLRNFSVSSPSDSSSSSSSGSGSGGGGTIISKIGKTYSITQEKLIKGYNLELKKDDKIEFNLSVPADPSDRSKTEKHSLTVNSVGNNSVNLTLQSSVINMVLSVRETKKFNLTSDEYYDLYLRLESIVDKKANLTIKEIYENISGQLNQSKNITVEKEEFEKDKNFLDRKKLNIKYILQNIVFTKSFLIITAIIVIIVIIVVILRKKKPIKRKKSKSLVLRYSNLIVVKIVRFKYSFCKLFLSKCKQI